MSFALPPEIRDYVSTRVQSGEYGNTSEYIRDLIRRDQREQAARHLRRLIVDGMESGEARRLTDEVFSGLRRAALGTDR